VANVKATSWVDAEACLVEWANSRTGDLVGSGNPLPAGFRYTQPDSRRQGQHRGAYGLVSIIGGEGSFLAEGGMMRARLSVAFVGDKRETVARAAFMYCNLLEQFTPAGGVLVLDGTVRIAFADNISGPLFTTYEDQTQYLVDCDLYLQVIHP